MFTMDYWRGDEEEVGTTVRGRAESKSRATKNKLGRAPIVERKTELEKILIMSDGTLK